MSDATLAKFLFSKNNNKPNRIVNNQELSMAVKHRG